MKRRELLKSIPLAAMAPALGTADTTSGLGLRLSGAATKYPFTLQCIGLWILGYDVDSNNKYLAAVNADKITIPGGVLHVHTPLLILPPDSLLEPAKYADLTEVERTTWVLPAGDLKKVPLKANFTVDNVDGAFDEFVLGVVPLRRINPGLPIKVRWFTEPDKATAYTYLKGGELRSARPRMAVKAAWTFDYALNKPGTDTPTRLTDTLEWTGEGDGDIQIKPDGATVVNKANIALDGFLVNLPHNTTVYEGAHKETLYHVHAMYKIFETPPHMSLQRIPWTADGDLPSGEPVFCPPRSAI
jgi:hypothetical protein